MAEARIHSVTWLWRALPCLILIVIQSIWVSGFSANLDLNIVDEITYWGRAFGPFDLAYSPPFSIAHAILSPVVAVVDVLPPDVMTVVCVLAAPPVLWWALRPLMPATAAFLVACWWGASPLVLGHDRILRDANSSVYLFTWILAAASVGCFARRRFVTGTLVMAVVVLNRGEYAPWMLFHGCLLTALSLSPRWRAVRPAGLLAVAVGSALLVLFALHGAAREKSWLTFRQHYAFGSKSREMVQAWHAAGGLLSPEYVRQGIASLERSFVFPEQTIAADFPGADSVLAARRANPERFREHVLDNLRGMPLALQHVTASSWSFAPAVRSALLTAAALLAAAGLAVALVTKRSPFLGGPAAWTALLATVTLLLAPLVVRARADLMIGVALLPLALAGTLIGAAARVLPLPHPVAAWCARLTPLLLLGLVLLAPKPYPTDQRKSLQHRAAVQCLADALPTGNLLLMGAHVGSYAMLASRSDLRAIDIPEAAPTEPAASFADALLRHHPDLVLVTPFLEQCYPEVRATLAQQSWTLLSAANAVSLFERPR